MGIGRVAFFLVQCPPIDLGRREKGRFGHVPSCGSPKSAGGPGQKGEATPRTILCVRTYILTCIIATPQGGGEGIA